MKYETTTGQVVEIKPEEVARAEKLGWKPVKASKPKKSEE